MNMTRVFRSLSSRLGTALLVGACLASCTNPSTTNEGPVIDHIAPTDVKPAGQAVSLSARVTDSDSVASVTLYYQAPHAATWQTVAMAPDATQADTYVGEIPASAVVAPTVSYYFNAADRKGASATLPVGAPAEYFSITVAGDTSDTSGPIISHVPVADGRVLGTPVDIVASVTDASGVASVTCHYRAQGATDWIDLPLTATGVNNKYQATLPNEAVVPPGLEYWLEATDQDVPTPRTSKMPADAPAAFYSFTVSPGDDQPPVITHTPIADGQPEGRPVGVTATVSDQSGIAYVKLFYRVTGTTDWTEQAMVQGSGTASPWTGAIAAAAVTPAGVDYYLEAKDSAPMGNVARDPADAPTTVHHFTAVPETCVVPPLAAEGFEAGGVLPGWWRAFTGAGGSSGCGWKITNMAAHGGTYAAGHGWGTTCNDLLVLPCLDLTNAPPEGLIFDWWQGEDYSADAQSHTLEYAFDNADPATSTYTAFTPALPIEADGGWVHQRVTIPADSPIMGHNKVYLAFRYVGNNADWWAVDDVAVRPPSPKMDLDAVATTPDIIQPGATGVAVTITLKNNGERDAAAFTGTLSTTDSLVTVTTAAGSFGACAVGATVASGDFRLSVDAAHATGEVPLTLTLSDGEIVTVPLFVGVHAVAHIKMTTTGATWESDMELYVGTGADTANPVWISTEINGTASTAGTYAYDVDVSTHVADLPPSATHPWFLKAVDTYSGGNATIDEFYITYGASKRYPAGGLPVAVPGSETVFVMIPSPTDVVVDSIVTAPTTVAPGTSNVQLTIRVRNDGGVTQGPVTGTLAPKDQATTDAVQNLDVSTPHAFGSAALDLTDTADGTPWTFDVLATHNDGTPLTFVLTLTDGTTTWHRDVGVPVPWPGLTVVGWTTSSATADFDFLPDPGETDGLVVTLQNTGTLATAGTVTGTLTWDASGAPGSVVAGTEQQSFSSGALAVGAIGTSANPFQIQVDVAAQMHQKIIMSLALSDGTNNWTRPLVIPLYALLGVDPQHDAGASTDLQAAYFFCDNTDLEVRIATFGQVDAAAAALNVIIVDASGGAYRLSVDAGAVAADTWQTGGWTPETTVPPSLTVAPATGMTSAITFRVKVADLTKVNLSGKQAKFAVESVSSVGSIADALPDAWTGSNFTASGSLISATWP
jgi:hypothetical protein